MLQRRHCRSLYRPGSVTITQFFHDFSDLLERLAAYSALMIVGNFSIYVDDVTDINAGELIDITIILVPKMNYNYFQLRRPPYAVFNSITRHTESDVFMGCL